MGVAAFVLGGIVAGIVPGSLIAANVAAAQTASTIIVQGNQRIEADTIRSYFRTGPGERLDAIKIDEGYKALIATGLFQEVRLGQSGGRLVVTVVEAPVLNRVAFEGNKRVKDEQLAAEVQSKARGTFSRAVVQSDVQRIIDIYRATGRYDVRVDPKIIELPNNRVDLVFEITEGLKTSVRQINFVGARSFSSSRLKDVIKTGETGLLSFLRTNDIYDPDRIEADRDLLRRFYLRQGFADVRVVSAAAEYVPARNGFIITFVIEEGERYRFGAVDVQSNVRDVDPAALRTSLRTKSGSTYNADAVEKTVEELTIELAKRGYAFAQVRPRGARDFETRTITLTYVIEEGPRAYIERINVRGNTRTRDYVIRREFDIAEGDAYNRALIDRAERRLKNLNYFKNVRITNEPGSAPDRVVVNVDVEEQSTGEFSVAGGYSSQDGFLGEVSISERNLLGRGQFARAAVQYGTKARGFELGFAEPYFLGYRVALGLDAFSKKQLASSNQSYDNELTGGAIRFGFPLRDDFSLQLRYSAYRQEIELPTTLNNCSLANPPPGCYLDGEASLAVRQAVASGPILVSYVGHTLTYNTVDNNKNPTSGFLGEIKQDFAGVGGDVNFIRTSAEARYYYEIMSDLVSLVRVQGGHIAPWGGQSLRMLDHFFMGPNLVRGFAPSGIGPRDLTPGTTRDALGGSLYWGATVELQHPIFFAPKDFGMKLAVFADAGSLWNYKGPVTFPATGEVLTLSDNSMKVRTSVGAGILWASPFGPLRFDYAFALSKESYDRIQQFRFSGGTRF